MPGACSPRLLPCSEDPGLFLSLMPALQRLQRLQRWAPAADVCRFRGEGSRGQGVGVAEGGAPLALIVSNLSVA